MSGGASDHFDVARAACALTATAARAGAAIMRHYREGPAVELKADLSPVTSADHESQAIILKALEQLAPDIPVVSEEDAADRKAPLPSRFFLVDPLDGTKEFINKRTDFTVNIALVDGGRPGIRSRLRAGAGAPRADARAWTRRDRKTGAE